ncbi:unnamed protein product [Caenorhabditis angaria]|uniref:RRM domain-containing protein n=1 Tax=Caenorhabditis angaria TaxID=860376 RepID=A0A9P1IAN5_9PELO|nr:unnamed protein product [Caenorhabditis angaria]
MYNDDYQRRDPRADPPNKRYRRDDDADPTNPNPSLVVHIRNLNPKATEADLLEALSSFGPIAYATCIPYSRMALVEFEDIESAKACVHYAQSSQINVGGQVAQFNFSTSLCIERMGFEQANPNKVLVLTVLNAVYPIDADVIHQICRPHGDVVRIAVMHKPTIVQALVEYPNSEVAKSAKHAMNGADIYSGCCTLKVEFARPDTVRVTRQDKDQRDFTLPQTIVDMDGPSRKPLIEDGPITDPYYANARNDYGIDRDDRYNHSVPQQYPPSDYPQHQPRGGREYDDRFDNGQPTQGGPGCVMMIYGLDHEKINCEKLFNVLCLYGNVLRISFMRTKTETGMIEMGQSRERQNVLDYLGNFEMFGLTLEFKPSHQECVHTLRDPFNLPDGSPSFRDFTSSRNQRFSTPEFAQKNRIVAPTNVLHWFNAPGTMDEETLTKMIAEKTEHKALKIEIFPSRNERSAAGTAEFENVQIANEVLALVNHTPVDSPYGSAPFIVKWAYATPRRWEGSEAPPPRQPIKRRFEDDDRRSEHIQPAERTFRRDFDSSRGGGFRGGFRGGSRGFAPRGRGSYSDRGSFRGSSRGRFNNDY